MLTLMTLAGFALLGAIGAIGIIATTIDEGASDRSNKAN